MDKRDAYNPNQLRAPQQWLVSKSTAVQFGSTVMAPFEEALDAAATHFNVVHLPSSKVTVMTSPLQSTTACLLQRLKGVRHEQPPEPSESTPDDLLSRVDVTDTETESLLRAAPAPVRGRPLSELTTTNNTLGLDVGATTTYPPSSTLVSSKAAGWRWPERDPDIDKSVPFLTSAPPLSPHKPIWLSYPRQLLLDSNLSRVQRL